MLRFCYTGECLVARGSVLALLLLADRFAVPALHAACEEARCVHKRGQCAERAHVALAGCMQGHYGVGAKAADIFFPTFPESLWNSLASSMHKQAQQVGTSHLGSMLSTCMRRPVQ